MRFGITGAVLAAAAMLAVAAPIAQAAEFDVGPGGVRVREHRDRDCRVVIDHRMNDRGDRVTVRRRICD